MKEASSTEEKTKKPAKKEGVVSKTIKKIADAVTHEPKKKTSSTHSAKTTKATLPELPSPKATRRKTVVAAPKVVPLQSVCIAQGPRIVVKKLRARRIGLV